MTRIISVSNIKGSEYKTTEAFIMGISLSLNARTLLKEELGRMEMHYSFWV